MTISTGENTIFNLSRWDYYVASMITEEMDLMCSFYSFSSERLLRGLAIVNLLFAPLLFFLRNPPAKHQLLQNEDTEGIIY